MKRSRVQVSVAARRKPSVIRRFFYFNGLLKPGLFGFGLGIGPVIERMAKQLNTESFEPLHLHAVLRIELHIITGRFQDNARDRRVIGSHEVQRPLHGIDCERVAGMLQRPGNRCLLSLLLPFPSKKFLPPYYRIQPILLPTTAVPRGSS